MLVSLEQRPKQETKCERCARYGQQGKLCSLVGPGFGEEIHGLVVQRHGYAQLPLNRRDLVLATEMIIG